MGVQRVDSRGRWMESVRVRSSDVMAALGERVHGVERAVVRVGGKVWRDRDHVRVDRQVLGAIVDEHRRAEILDECPRDVATLRIARVLAVERVNLVGETMGHGALSGVVRAPRAPHHDAVTVSPQTHEQLHRARSQRRSGERVDETPVDVEDPEHR